MEPTKKPLRAVRNFFLEAEVDGRTKPVRCGPRGRKGGMRVTLHQRCQGEPELALEILCRVYGSGLLQIEIAPRTGFVVDRGVIRLAPGSR